MEERGFLTEKFPHDNIYDLNTLKLWEMMEIVFMRPRNITFDCYIFFSRKQKKGETVEQFYSNLEELAENCGFKNREEVIIRDIFITNMLDDDIQRELRDTVDPERCLSIAVNMKMGHQNQQRISSNNNNNSATGSATNAIHFTIDFVARIHAEINQAELHSIEQRLASGEVLVKFGLQHIVRFALLWVKNAIIVVYSTISQRYVEKKLSIHEAPVKIIASMM